MHSSHGTANVSALEKISKRGEYALRALIDFGLAEAADRPLLQLSELASKEDFPVKFLEQILMQLKAAGYLESRRGKLGGYLLARPPENICLGQVIRMIDGPLAPISCVSQTAYERCSCPDEEHCGLRMLMLDVRSASPTYLTTTRWPMSSKSPCVNFEKTKCLFLFP